MGQREHPKSDNCNNCGRKVSKGNDFDFVELREEYGGGFWYPLCRWCRGAMTRKFKGS